jgi:hypothetical protein
MLIRSRSRSYFTTDSQSVCLGIEHPCGACDQILLPVGMLLSEMCDIVYLGRPLWREEGSAICSVITQWSESLRSSNHLILYMTSKVRSRGVDVEGNGLDTFCSNLQYLKRQRVYDKSQRTNCYVYEIGNRRVTVTLLRSLSVIFLWSQSLLCNKMVPSLFVQTLVKNLWILDKSQRLSDTQTVHCPLKACHMMG